MAIVNIKGQSGGGKEIVTYAASLASTSSADTDVTITGMDEIVQFNIYFSGNYRWSLYTDDGGDTWRHQYNNTAVSLPATLYSSAPYVQLTSIMGNVIRIATSASSYLVVIGYKE